jgi:divalent metal cation (Fe/Co/Zn/Cd) transporter
MAHADSTRAIFFALGANLSIAASKGVAAVLSGSSAMLAETVHSIADSGNQLLLLLGINQAQAPASAEFPLGLGKRSFWSFLVAVMLFSLGGMFFLYEGIHKLHHPEPLKDWWWAAGVLALSIAAEGTSMRAYLKEVNKSRGSHSVLRWVKENRQAELIVIFGEGFAALVGLTLALIAILQLGNDVMLSVKACMEPMGSAPEMIRAINAVEAAVKQKFPDIRWSFFEPDETDR